MSRVYFIKPVGLDGPIKIGCSYRPENRLLDLGAWSPWPLEIIGSVPGIYHDEQFLHRCFADSHSHREWFHSTPALRDAIAVILSAGDMTVAHSTLTPKGSIRTGNKNGWTEERKLRASYSSRIRIARNKLREKNIAEWHPAEDVNKIGARWNGGQLPTEAEFARLDEYLSDPAAHSVVPYWQKAAA